jgi:hypothetical protein
MPINLDDIPTWHESECEFRMCVDLDAVEYGGVAITTQEKEKEKLPTEEKEAIDTEGSMGENEIENKKLTEEKARWARFPAITQPPVYELDQCPLRSFLQAVAELALMTRRRRSHFGILGPECIRGGVGETGVVADWVSWGAERDVRRYETGCGGCV